MNELVEPRGLNMRRTLRAHILAALGRDWHAVAKHGNIRTIVGRRHEVHILGSVLVDDARSGRSARILKRKVPRTIKIENASTEQYRTRKRLDARYASRTIGKIEISRRAEIRFSALRFYFHV